MTRSNTIVPSRMLAALGRWSNRVYGIVARSNDMRELQAMSDHALKDLGIGRSEVQAWSRRRATAARHGTPEHSMLRERPDAGCDSTRRNAEHRQHDGRQHLRRGLFAGNERVGLRGRQAAGMEHVLVGMKGCGHTNS